jgi:importin subunit alpha-6/7
VCGPVQAVIEAEIIPPLVNLLGTAEFDIKKEAAWAISNATSGGSQQQIQYLVRCGCIKPLCDLLACSDVRIVTVALEGLENILKVKFSPN